MAEDCAADARRRLAVHEAGHALIACICAVPFCEVTIEPTPGYFGALGGLLADKTKPLTEQWKFDASDHKRYMLTTAGGAAAEIEAFDGQFGPQDFVGVSNDMSQLMSIAKRVVAEDKADAYAVSMIREARDLVRTYRSALDLISEALLANTRLTGQQVAALVKGAAKPTP